MYYLTVHCGWWLQPWFKRCLHLGRKAMANLDSIFKSRGITLPTEVRLVKSMVFPVVMYGCESWMIKKAEHRRIDAFELWYWRRLLRVPWTARRSNPVHPKGNQSWIFTGRIDDEAKIPILWPPNEKWLIWKDLNAGKDWRWEEKGMTKDEMVGWHHWLDGHEFELAPGVGDGQGSLACCSPWGHKELHMTERLNWLNWTEFIRLLSFLKEGSYSSENYEICVCAFWWGEGMVFDWYKSHWFLTMNFKSL